MNTKNNHTQEWLKQAEYDLATAKMMFKTGRYIYCVFMCHLSLEKILKASYIKNLEKNPPKVHNLVYLVTAQKLNLPKLITDFLDDLNEISVPTRYPQELAKILVEYNKKKTQEIFNKTTEAFLCLKKRLKKS